MATNIFAPNASLKQGTPATGTAMQLVDTAAAALLALPVDTSTAAPSLQTDMQNAQALATQWQAYYRPQVVLCLEGIVDFNSVYQGEFQELYPESEQIAAGDTSAIPPFQANLANLQKITQTQAQAAAFVQQNLMDYSTSINSSQQALNADDVLINSAIAADQQAMQVDQQEMDHLNDEYEQLEWDIMKNQGNPMRQELQVLMDELNHAFATLNDEMNAVASDEGANSADLTHLQSNLSDLTSYLTDLSQLLSGINGLTAGWEEITGDFQNLLDDEDITTYSVFTPDDIQTAAKDWAELALLAHSFMA